MKITAISDFHGFFPKIEPCDIVCISGDLVSQEVDKDIDAQWVWYNDVFVPWAKALPCQYVIFTAGNHDKFVYKYSVESDDKLIFLLDSGVEINGYSFYGTPHTCKITSDYEHLPFDEELYAKFMTIPAKVDFLLSHASPFDANNTGMRDNERQTDIGCKELSQALKGKEIKYIFCGHIHTGNHELTSWNGGKIANVAFCNDQKTPSFSPITIEI